VVVSISLFVGDVALEIKFEFDVDLILLLLLVLLALFADSELEVVDLDKVEIGLTNGLFVDDFKLSVSFVLNLLVELTSIVGSVILEESRLTLFDEFDSCVGDVLAYVGDLLFRLEGGDVEPSAGFTTLMESHNFSS